MNQDNIKVIREAVIKVNPEIKGRPIRLSGILLTILGTPQKPRLSAGWRDLEKFMNPYIHWDLQHDNLNEQSPKTMNFLYNLLK